MSKAHIKKGDTVKVITGDDKGKQGRILTVLVKKHRAIVEGLGMVSKHTKPNKENQKGGIIKKEASIHISNLMLLEKSSAEPAGKKKIQGKKDSRVKDASAKDTKVKDTREKTKS